VSEEEDDGTALLRNAPLCPHRESSLANGRGHVRLNESDSSA
jgi:hypothetical protein